jgi:hypothetical protein
MENLKMSDYNGFTNGETWNLRNWMINEYPPAQPETLQAVPMLYARQSRVI